MSGLPTPLRKQPPFKYDLNVLRHRAGFGHVEAQGSLCVEALSTSRKYYSRSMKYYYQLVVNMQS